MVFLIGVGFNILNFILFKFLNILYICKNFFYDSLFNINFFNYCFFINKKILIGKKHNQLSILKKTIYIKYFISFYKFFIFSRVKSGDINFFSRINNEILFLTSFKIFFLILSNITIPLYSLNYFNFFLTYRFNFSNIIFFIYLNNLNVFKFYKCFLNKTIIYYMVNNNIFYFLYSLNDFKLYYIFFSELSSFYSEHIFFFNLKDLYLDILFNFLFFKYPKYIIINNFFNFINLINFKVNLY